MSENYPLILTVNNTYGKEEIDIIDINKMLDDEQNLYDDLFSKIDDLFSPSDETMNRIFEFAEKQE